MGPRWPLATLGLDVRGSSCLLQRLETLLASCLQLLFSGLCLCLRLALSVPVSQVRSALLVSHGGFSIDWGCQGPPPQARMLSPRDAYIIPTLALIRKGTLMVSRDLMWAFEGGIFPSSVPAGTS